MAQQIQPWWKQSVVYQIYPRSFCDTNGDGIGDLNGITSKLDYLQTLGVDVVWLSPVYKSPNDDNGYDISDYRDIMEEFGTLADFDAMLAGMHQRGIKLMMDLVVNHSSDEHAWFTEARKSRDNPHHDYYIWREPQADGSPPTNWEAAFTGSVWEFNEPTGEYYLHMFSKKQPDLNWENPKLRQEVYALMRFWLDRGVDGFRMDVINMISKPWLPDGSLPQAAVVRDGFLQPGFALSCNGPRLLEFLREMREQVLDHYDTITVGEAPMATVVQGQELTNADTAALNMLFQFEHMDVDSLGGHINGKWALKPLHLPDLTGSMSRWQDALAGNGWNSLYLCNHDQPRSVSRFGNEGRYRVESAKMLATYLHGMQGTPYVYQGEELGMTNVHFAAIEDYRDLETLNYYRVATQERGEDPAAVMQGIDFKSRDNARTPMQWSPGAQAGFTTGTPWISINHNFHAVNADQALKDEGSVFHYYRRLIALRKTEPLLVLGRYVRLLPDSTAVAGYLRQGVTSDSDANALLVLCNFTDQAQPVDGWAALEATSASLVIGNLPNFMMPEGVKTALTLRPYEAVILRLR